MVKNTALQSKTDLYRDVHGFISKVLDVTDKDVESTNGSPLGVIMTSQHVGGMTQCKHSANLYFIKFNSRDFYMISKILQCSGSVVEIGILLMTKQTEIRLPSDCNFFFFARAVGRQRALHKQNSGFASPTLGRHISTFRGYQILFSIRNPYINCFTNHFSNHS